MNVSFDEVKDIFEKSSYWAIDRHIYWFEYVWNLLEKDGRTSYTNDLEYYTVIVYAVVLSKTYYKFGAILGGDYSDEFSLYNLVTDLMDDVIVGQFVKPLLKEDDIVKSCDDAMDIIIDHYTNKVYDLVKPYLDSTDLFVWMYATIGTFYHFDPKTGEDIEYEVNSLQEFETMIEETTESILDTYTNDKYQAYEYATQLIG